MSKIPKPMVVLTTLAMIAFAGNSLLCRMALKNTRIDPASFTSIRIFSGALVLWLIVRVRGERVGTSRNWLSALALFAYAAGFAFAYVSLPTAAGALILFSAVQATMIGYGFWVGERMRRRQVIGLITAFGGLVGLLLPGLSAPPLHGSIMMLGAGAAWGIYSLRGKTTGNAIGITAGNFLGAVPFAAGLSIVMIPGTSMDIAGITYAVASGALASGVGYAIWYTVVPRLMAAQAAVIQLSVPVLAAVGGVLLLGEPITLRLLLSSIAILGGIGLVVGDLSLLRP